MVMSFDVMRLVLHAVQLVNGWGYICSDLVVYQCQMGS